MALSDSIEQSIDQVGAATMVQTPRRRVDDATLEPVALPVDYDYVGVYLTEVCHLSCAYCITRHHGAQYGGHGYRRLGVEQWIAGLNRLALPVDVPITLQGGEPFLYPDIWKLLEGLQHKVDILTALPPRVTREHFVGLQTLQWNQRPAPYPRIRVSYHRGQHDWRQLLERIARLQDILSIGLFYLDVPATPPEEGEAIRRTARRLGVEVRSKEFLGWWQGHFHGTIKYPGACEGTRQGRTVWCRNTVVPIAPDGLVYRCHSDLYFRRTQRAIGHVLDTTLQWPTEHTACGSFGLCSECDVKVKTNRYQVHGYTSADIRFEPPASKEHRREAQTAKNTDH